MSRGMPLDEAAAQCGIPVDECIDYIKEKTQQLDTLNFELRKSGQKAIQKALDKLTKLAEGSVREGKDFESTDLKAAEALAKFGIEALKLAKAGKAAGTSPQGQPDLFETPSAMGPWTLKKIE